MSKAERQNEKQDEIFIKWVTIIKIIKKSVILF